MAGVTETVALDFFVVSAALVAVTVTLVLPLTVGAVNIPPLDIEPAVADQVTAVLLVPCTVAANCLLFPAVKLTLFGETETLMPAATGLTVTVALAFFVVSAALVAVTVTAVLLDTLGAVNNPLLEIVPELADHVTAVFVVPCTVALKG